MSFSSLQFIMSDAGPQASFVEGPTRIYRLGYCWWEYGDFAGELLYIRFAKQVFLPPDRIVTAFSWDLAPGVKGKWYATYTKLNELPVDVINQGVSLAIGKMQGLGQIGLDPVTGATILGAAPVLKKLGTNKRLLR